MKKALFLVATFFSVLFLLAVQPAFADAQPCDVGGSNLNLTDCYKLNPKTGTTVADTYGTTPAVLINLFIKVVFIAAGIMVFFMIIYAGFLFITGSTKGKEDATKVLTSAVIGLIVMFAAYWIMQIIKLLTGADIGF